MGIVDSIRRLFGRADRAMTEADYAAIDAVHDVEDRLDDATGGRFYDAVEKADEDAVRETFHRFVEHDVPFTIATDGPEMMRTHLRDEFELLHRIGALDEDGLARANARGHAAAFVGRGER